MKRLFLNPDLGNMQETQIFRLKKLLQTSDPVDAFDSFVKTVNNLNNNVDKSSIAYFTFSMK